MMIFNGGCMEGRSKFKKIIKELLKNNNASITAENFICIEMLLEIIYETKQKPSDGWILLTQYYKYILEDKFSEVYGRKLYGLRRKFHNMANKSNWIINLDEYFSLDINLRLFKLTGEKLDKLSLKYLVDRETYYEDIIYELTNAKTIKPFFSEPGYTRYYKVLRNHRSVSEMTSNKVERSLNIPDALVNIQNDKLPQYKPKIELSIPSNYNWKNIYDRMGSSWSKRPVFKIINEFSGNEDEVKYKNQIHIAGDVGKGKSNYKIAETVRLVQNFGAKVGIIESKVDDVINTVRLLREVGIEAVPIIGKSDLEKHADTFIRNAGRKLERLGNISSEDFKELEYLSGFCIAAVLAEDNDITAREFPCTKLIDEEEESKVCPLYNKCGFYKSFTKLVSSQVWVATPHSLINMSVPKTIDPYERSFYEAFHDLLDIVIIDEADGVQRTLDDLFITNEDLFGPSNSILGRFEKLNEDISYLGIANSESLAYTWQMNFAHLQVLLPKLNRMVANTEALKAYLRREIITSFSLFNDIKESLKVEEYTQNLEIIKKLEQYLDYANTYDIQNHSIKHEFNELYNEFVWVQNIGKVEEIIKQRIVELFNQYKVIVPKQKNIDLLYAKFELFIYLVQLDFYIKVLSRDYPLIMQKINNSYEKINVYEGIRKSLRSFLTEPLTGVIFGYKFILQGKDNGEKISLFRYSGVGRRLLDHFHEIKKEIGLKGPAIVLLSGTSIAPGSGHYDLRKVPEYMLKSFDEDSKIEQKLLMKFDEEGNLIKVSGLKGEERAAALRKLTRYLIRNIRMELSYWKEKDEDRKVLLIVNSYDNCKEVGKVLRNSGLNYRVLSREIEEKYDFSKELLENFKIESGDAEILVAPLNVISRGYNILNEYNKSYFGSVFFMIRPYMVPDDLQSYFQILHSRLDEYIAKGKNKGNSLGEVMNEIRRLSYIDLAVIAQNRYWKTLDNDFKRNLAWFTLVPIKQTIGRLQRGGTNCRVFYCDGAFAPEIIDNEPLSSKNSMLFEWYNMLNENRNNLFIEELYGKYLRGLEGLIMEVNNQQFEGEGYTNE
ncbi:hypothetical protein HMPREF1982_01325 [Clostridiales bacterium oral taxon 876 str. F0540]|nr:hypothetical protein HMPREF1982_01325 [Clostridiales bacterium oral taxon 876 str. F0540]